MILPTIRASLSRSDAQQLVHLLGRADPELAEAARLRLEKSGIGSLLDDPRIQNALLTDPDVSVPPPIIFYVLVRQALLEGGIDDEGASDYVASMLVSFGRARRAYRIGVEHGQVVDERRQLSLVCRTDSLGYGGRSGHDGFDVAPAAETELLQRLLVQRVGNGQPEGSVGGRQRKNGASTGQRGVYEPQGLSLADQGPLGKRESELSR